MTAAPRSARLAADAEPIRLPRRAGEELWLSLAEFRGRRYADIRVRYLNGDGQYAPSVKGITVTPSRWPDFLAAVLELDRRMCESGLVRAAKLEGSADGDDDA